MTDQEHTFELATGTVPDPFGLGWDLEREKPEEDAPVAEASGLTTSGATESNAGGARLGELD